MRSPKTILPILAITAATMISPAFADSPEAKNSGVIYNSVITPLPGNQVSQAFEAWQVSEFGNAVTFASGKNQEISKVVVTMSSWGCESGGWSVNTCSTSEDATFSLPITLNIYSPSVDGVNPGKKISSVTKNFDIKFRPSASPLCTGGNAGKWYDKSAKHCYNGLAQNITFRLNSVKVGGGAIFGIAYNTTHFGYFPIGEVAPCFKTSAGCGYDSLNVAVSEDPTNVTAGNSVDPGKLWAASTNKGMYADNGAAGLGTFRIDSPNTPAWWGVNDPYTSAPWYVPSIKVFANSGSGNENQSDDKSSSNKIANDNSDSHHGAKKG